MATAFAPRPHAPLPATPAASRATCATATPAVMPTAELLLARLSGMSGGPRRAARPPWPMRGWLGRMDGVCGGAARQAGGRRSILKRPEEQMGRRFIGLEFDWMGMPMHGPGHSCRGHFCLFSLYLTLLTLLHGTGASGTFRFKKQRQTCKVKKIGANLQLELKTRAVMQLAQNN